MTSRSRTLAARFVVPVEGPPIADGLVAIRGGRITEVAPRAGRRADLDLGNAAITPGFVNAHTHLELEPVHGQPDDRPDDQIAWLKRVIRQRRRGSRQQWRSASYRNVAAAVRAGTTMLADITTAGASWDAVAAAPVRAAVFSEVIGLRRERAMETNQRAWEWIASVGPEAQVSACARVGLSPHAPYSTAGWLYRRAAECRLPLTTHLAEMPEELELLDRGTGRLREFLEELGAWDDDWTPIGPRPADFVRRGELRRADWLIAHGTYLDPADFWQLRPEAAPDGQRVAVAYCPRTHARFGHDPHPFRLMLERGVIVCLGTDSLASAPTLSILDEMRFLHRRDPSLPGALLLTMGTLFGAWALRAETVTGSLRPGKSADLAVVPLPDRDGADPYPLILESDLPVAATMFEGRFVSGPWTETAAPRP
jgi:cytosine/adenosine deaminase-related metal-dependent hydrolase